MDTIAHITHLDFSNPIAPCSKGCPQGSDIREVLKTINQAEKNGLTPEEITELMLLTRRCQNAIQKAMNPDGFNVGINLGKVAGAGIVEHLHVHIVPR